MSTDTTDTGERLARGEIPLPDEITECRFCGAGRDDLHHRSDIRDRNQHDHHATRVTTLSCEQCDGALVTEEHIQGRVTLPSDPTLRKRWWSIPAGYVMSVCAGCSGVAGAHAVGDALLAAIEDDEITTTCCGAHGRVETDRVVVEDDR